MSEVIRESYGSIHVHCGSIFRELKKKCKKKNLDIPSTKRLRINVLRLCYILNFRNVIL